MFKNRKLTSTATHWAVFDGRQMCGAVDQIDGQFTARGADGELVGAFPSLRAAVDALDTAE
jgi:hypothetical protein